MDTVHIKEPAKNSINWIIKFFECLIFGGRWVLAPMYVGLLVAAVVYVLKFGEEIVNLFGFHIDFFHLTDAELMLRVLSLVDTCMIGNLIMMILVGSYTIFVRRVVSADQEQPRWMENITPSALKIKMAMSLVGVSSIDLLKDFKAEAALSPELMWRHIIIHGVFILSCMALACTDKMVHGNSAHQSEHK